MVGVIVEVGAADDAQTCTIFPAQGGEGQIEYHGVTDQRLKVDAFVDHEVRILLNVVVRVEVQLLQLQFEVILDRTQTS
ncbi:Uncharacterised protein [Mycobacteroides abscessus subsp. abscessus]|nr:Uncharacterised protein [Mycobacteroides abscessus subsp. abscessus]